MLSTEHMAKWKAEGRSIIIGSDRPLPIDAVTLRFSDGEKLDVRIIRRSTKTDYILNSPAPEAARADRLPFYYEIEPLTEGPEPRGQVSLQ